MMLIGQRIKHTRNSKGLTLKELSAMTDLSIGYLSQLERGLNSVAVDSLAKIADALGVTLHYFIEQSPQKRDAVIMRSYERDLLFAENNSYIQYHLSADKSDKVFLPRLIEILPAKEDHDRISYCHEGEEFLYILEGVLTLHYDNQKYDLYPGDSAHYNSKIEHTWANYTNKIVKYICVNSPNLFRAE